MRKFFLKTVLALWDGWRNGEHTGKVTSEYPEKYTDSSHFLHQLKELMFRSAPEYRVSRRLDNAYVFLTRDASKEAILLQGDCRSLFD